MVIAMCLVVSCNKIPENGNATNLVLSNPWYLAGPAIESEETLNTVRKNHSTIRVTVNNDPLGEIELNVMITPSVSNDGSATDLPDNSTFVEITYRSSHLITLQAREGNASDTGCVHGGSHPRIDLVISADKFSTIRIPWKNFKQDGLLQGTLLNINNLCKFNFVNYNPVAGAILEITSLSMENVRL
jgi:hypothetical protein